MTATIFKTSDQRARLNNAMADIYQLLKQRAENTNCPRLKEAVSRRLYLVDYTKSKRSLPSFGAGKVVHFDRKQRDQIVKDVQKIIRHDNDIDATAYSDLLTYAEVYFKIKAILDKKHLHAKTAQRTLETARNMIMLNTSDLHAANLINF